jgi:hypothetical protein
MWFTGKDLNGRFFDVTASLVNLSSTGAYFLSPNPVSSGAIVELRIRVPFKKTSWMRYSGQIVRLSENNGIAVKFDEPRPVFE